MAEYSADLYAKTPQERANYVEYYRYELHFFTHAKQCLLIRRFFNRRVPELFFSVPESSGYRINTFIEEKKSN
jgi:hypothetical protein